MVKAITLLADNMPKLDQDMRNILVKITNDGDKQSNDGDKQSLSPMDDKLSTERLIDMINNALSNMTAAVGDIQVPGIIVIIMPIMNFFKNFTERKQSIKECESCMLEYYKILQSFGVYTKEYENIVFNKLQAQLADIYKKYINHLYDEINNYKRFISKLSDSVKLIQDLVKL